MFVHTSTVIELNILLETHAAIIIIFIIMSDLFALSQAFSLHDLPSYFLNANDGAYFLRKKKSQRQTSMQMKSANFR